MGFIEEQQLESAYVMGTYARKPVELVRGRGMRVEDAEGRTYLDFVSGVGAVSLGYCHPALVSAIEEQASTLVHVSNYYYIEHRGEVAHLVSDLLNECVDEAEREPWQSFFANSGAEANECAFKLARLHAKKRAMAAAEAAGADEDRSAPPPQPPRRASSSRSTPASTAARWPRWPPRRSPPSRRRSSPCPTASSARPSTISRRSSRCSPPRATASAPSWWSACRARAACIRASPSS